MPLDTSTTTILLIPRTPGIYTLVLNVVKDTELTIGKLGRFFFEEGYYVYVGSARGFGGLRARIKRHLSRSKKLKWHIDYLTACKNIMVDAVVFSCSRNADTESRLASLLYRELAPFIKRFGSSDTRDYTHLFKCTHSLRECLLVIENAMKALGLQPTVLFFRQVY